MDAGGNDRGECHFMGEWRIEFINHLYVQGHGLQRFRRFGRFESSVSHNATGSNANTNTNTNTDTDTDTNSDTNPRRHDGAFSAKWSNGYGSVNQSNKSKLERVDRHRRFGTTGLPRLSKWNSDSHHFERQLRTDRAER